MNKLESLFTDKQLLTEIEKNVRNKHFKKGDILISPGNEIVFVPIVVKGSVRIIRQDEEGAEVFLYHLFPGQTCALSLTCCQSFKKSVVKAIAEDDTEVMLIPARLTEEWQKYEEWKNFVNTNYGNRFAELIQVIDLIAFNNMDKQLLHYLRKRSKALNTNILYITHQEIADELHTHKEAISRLLRTMERKNILRLGRNNIEVLD